MTKLRTLREKARLSQGELADKIGSHQSKIAEWESGRRGIPLDKAKKAATVLDPLLTDLRPDLNGTQSIDVLLGRPSGPARRGPSLRALQTGGETMSDSPTDIRETERLRALFADPEHERLRAENRRLRSALQAIVDDVDMPTHGWQAQSIAKAALSQANEEGK